MQVESGTIHAFPLQESRQLSDDALHQSLEEHVE
jgi:hypothetical protein